MKGAILPVALLGLVLLSSGGKAKASTKPSGGKSLPPAANAKALAQLLFVQVTTRGYNYDRKSCKNFQSAVHIKADGIYGPETRTALGKYLPTPPKALFKGAATTAAATKTKAQKPPAKTAAKTTPLPVYLVPASPPQGAFHPSSPPTVTLEDAHVDASPTLETAARNSPQAGFDPVKARSRARGVAAHLAKKGPASYSRPELKSWQTQAGLKPDGSYGGSTRGALIYYGVPNPPRPFAAPFATLPYVPPAQRGV